MTHTHKAITQPPPHRGVKPYHTQPDMFYVLGWLALPVVLVCVAVAGWKMLRAACGYRRVTLER